MNDAEFLTYNEEMKELQTTNFIFFYLKPILDKNTKINRLYTYRRLLTPSAITMREGYHSVNGYSTIALNIFRV